MSDELERPGWARYLGSRITVTRYTGEDREAVMWKGSVSRLRYQLTADNGDYIHVNISEAMAIAEMIRDDVEGVS